MDTKKKKEERVPLKLVLRRLPYTISEEELLEQLAPIPPHEAFWFCEADVELLPFSFCRAYIAFADENDAVSFRDRFNGYVFIDKQGNESMAICEMAPNQALPKRRREEAQKYDKRVGTIENEVEYLKFMDEYNSLTVQKVTNFDELIREAEEREKQLKQGIVKETPLTDFLMKQALEKEKKRAARSERHRGGWVKPGKGPATAGGGLKEEGREKEKKPRRERKPKEDRPQREPRGPKKTDKKVEKGPEQKEKPPKHTEERQSEKPGTSGVGNGKPAAKPKPPEKQKESESKPEGPKENPRLQEKQPRPPPPDQGGSSEGGTAKPARRNKERKPERAIYQPGRARPGAGGAARKKDASESGDKPT